MAGKLTLTALFARNLREAMTHARPKLSQQALARASGIAQASIGRILRGEQSPTLDAMEDLARALDVAPWMMLVDGFDPSNPPVLRPVLPAEQALYDRLLTAAQDLARYKTDDP